MIFEDIGIDLHFLFEADVNSSEAAEIFNGFHSAGQQVFAGSRKLGLFRVKENTREIVEYDGRSSGEAPSDSVTIKATHACSDSRRIIRVWRQHDTSAPFPSTDDTKGDRLTLRTFRRGASPGEGPLCETLPIEFGRHQTSTWIDAGLVFEVPGSDLELFVERSAPSSSIKARFVHVKPEDASPTTAFPGVLLSDCDPADLFGPRNIDPGSAAERQLRQYIDAHIARRNLTGGGTSTRPQDTNAHPYEHDAATDSRSPSPSQALLDAMPMEFGDSEPGLDRSEPSTRAVSAGPNGGPSHHAPVKAPGNISLPAGQPGPAGQPPSLNPLRWAETWNRFANIASQIAPARAAAIIHAATSDPAPAGQVEPASTRQTRPEEKQVGCNGTGGPTPADGNPTSLIHDGPQAIAPERERSATAPGEGDIRRELGALVDDINSMLDDTLDNMGLSVPTDGGPLPAPSGLVTTADQDMSNSSQASVQPSSAEEGFDAPRPVGVSYYDDSQSQPAGGSNQTGEALVLPTGAGSAEVQNTNINGPPGATVHDVDMEDAGPVAGDRNVHTRGDGAAGNVVQPLGERGEGESNVTMRNKDQKDIQIISSSLGAGATSDDRSMSCFRDASEAPLAHGTGLLTREALEAMNERRLVPSRAGTAGPQGLGGSGPMEMRHDRARSSSVSTVALRGFNPSAEQASQLYNYVIDLVARDKRQDTEECQRLMEERERKSDEFEVIRSRFEAEFEENAVQFVRSRTAVELKRDAIRLLRKQYNGHMGRPGFLAKLGVATRGGNDRRSRSRSRSREREIGPSASRAVSRRPTPSVVPPSLIKREHIDLTQDDGRYAAGGPAARRAASVASSVRSVGSARSSLSTNSVATGVMLDQPMKVGNVADLMHPPPREAKRSSSCAPDERAVRSASLRPRSSQDSQYTKELHQFVGQWLQGCSSRAGSRAPTPASRAGSRAETPIVVRDEEPIVVRDDEEPTPVRVLRSRSVSVAANRSRSVSRASSVATAGSNDSLFGPSSSQRESTIGSQISTLF